MESSALAIYGLRFEFLRGSRCGGENPALRSKLEMTTAPHSFFAPPAATVAAAGAVWAEYSTDSGK